MAFEAKPLTIGVPIEAQKMRENLGSREPQQTPSIQIAEPKPATLTPIERKTISEEFNILKDYIWTLSENKNSIIENVPNLIATEYNISTSPLVQNLKASFTIGIDALKKTGNIAGNAIAATVQTLGGSFNDIISPEWAKTFSEGADKAAQKISSSSAAQKAKTLIEKFKSNTGLNESSMSWHNEKLKKLYDHLYTVSPTRNKFIFPYLDDEFLSLSNQFSDSNEYLQFSAGLFNLDTGNAGKNLQKLSQLPALLSPGAYIQMPQFYDFNSVGQPSVTISFPLYNIVNSFETEKNTKFIKLFGLNNMPHRKDLIAVDPSRIYDILIPGKVNLPFCYVSDFKATHVGTKSLHAGVIYPEAYNITITFTSLLKYDANMYEKAMLMEGKYIPPPSNSTGYRGKSEEELQKEQFRKNALEKARQQEEFAKKQEAAAAAKQEAKQTAEKMAAPGARYDIIGATMTRK